MEGNGGSRKAVLLVFVVFALGIALGSVGMYVVTSRVHAARPQASLAHNPAGTLTMFTRDLNLNPDQQKQLEAIFNDTRARYAALHEKLDPEYEEVRHQGREKIRQILTPEQRPKFEELLRQIDEERRQRQSQGAHD
jgi:Spy/CpxP family protein refolding chaperone